MGGVNAAMHAQRAPAARIMQQQRCSQKNCAFAGQTVSLRADCRRNLRADRTATLQASPQSIFQSIPRSHINMCLCSTLLNANDSAVKLPDPWVYITYCNAPTLSCSCMQLQRNALR